VNETTPRPLGNVITIDDERIKSHLDRVVRGSVEETLNALLDAEADRLCNAQRYERTEARRDTRAGHYERKLQTKAVEVKLRIPKLRTQTSEAAPMIAVPNSVLQTKRIRPPIVEWARWAVLAEFSQLSKIAALWSRYCLPASVSYSPLLCGRRARLQGRPRADANDD
jgi:hypothetical protein